jgi:hypothetical protein
VTADQAIFTARSYTSFVAKVGSTVHLEEFQETEMYLLRISLLRRNGRI